MASTNSGLFAGLPPLPKVAGTEPERIALDAFRIAVADQVSKCLNLEIEKVYEGVQINAKGCDCNLAIPRFRLKGDPKAIARQIVEAFVPNDYIASAQVAGDSPFVNFHFHSPTFARLVLQQINQLNYLESPRDTPGAKAETKASAETTSQPEASSSTTTGPHSRGVDRGYGTNTRGLGKKALIDFSSPNIAKPFHAGHLRSTIIGMFCANVMTANGWKVTKMNYLGDWGKQYGLLAVGFDRHGSEEALKNDPIKHLYEVYVKINDDARNDVKDLIQKRREEQLASGEKVMIMNDKNEEVELTLDMETTRAEKEYGELNSSIHNAARALFRQMENSNPEALAIWKRFRDLSIVKYKEIYARLNIDFDIYWGESQVGVDAMDKAVDDLQALGLTYEDKGALLCKLDNKLGKVLIRKGDGAALYMTRDIGGAVERKRDYDFDKAIYVVAKQQELHFAQLFKVLELMKYPWAKDCQHVNFGMVAGMSTRKGTVVFLEDILDEAKEVMHAQMRSNEDKYSTIENPEKTSDIIGITAVKVQDMSGKRVNNYDFDWKRMTSFEGDTGPYLQYAHVRLASVERKSAPEVVLPSNAERASKINTDLIANDPKAREIIYLLASYPDVIKKAMDTLEPSNIVTFLFRLCHAISSAWEVLLVRGQESDAALARLWLYVSARDVLGHAMRILSLTPLDRM